MSDQAPRKDPSSKPSITKMESTPVSAPENREELVSHARNFLYSSPVQRQDADAKRLFLKDKGLFDYEVEALLNEPNTYAPHIPPRTYPQPPPSNLLTLLVGMIKLFSWTVGGMAMLAFLYHRLLLPRISRSFAARQSLRAHQRQLLHNFNESVSSLRKQHAENLSTLPKADLYREEDRYTALKSVAEILAYIEEQDVLLDMIPPVTVLRCALADLKRMKGEKDENSRSPLTEELFQVLEGQVPWLVSENGLKYEEKLWQTLNICPRFRVADDKSPSPEPTSESEKRTWQRWDYVHPEPVASGPSVASLQALSKVLPDSSGSEQKAAVQRTLKSLTDFTGYISSQLYTPYQRPVNGLSVSGGMHSPEYEEVRREIRSLKGLVLNRRSFMSAVPNTSSTSLHGTSQIS